MKAGYQATPFNISLNQCSGRSWPRPRDWGGSYAVTRGFTEALPYHRFFNTAIAEAGIVGAAIGYAMSGGRAVAEIMYCDFLGRAGDEFSVSRQIIVGDIALLRAAGADISATPRGYVILRETGGLVRQVAVQHDAAGMGEELNAMVDQGCTVLDVIVDHPIYGQLTGPLQLSNRYDVGQFLSRCAQSDARPLSELTEGIHLHTLSCPDEAAFGRVCRELRRLGVLLEG